MASILRPFVLLAKGIRMFFKADVRVRRGERGLQVVLDEKPAGARKPAKRVDPAVERERLELQEVQASLCRLLDDMPGSRVALRHLAFIEHALDKKGLRSLHKVPYDVLKRALEQFEGLVINWSDPGLATLRSKMAVTLIERDAEAPKPAAGDPAPDTNTEGIDTTAPLAMPVQLEGDEAAMAEAALREAYGSVVLPGLDLPPSAEPPALEMQGELNSPSGKALAKSARTAALV
jgi:hypothetical protein